MYVCVCKGVTDSQIRDAVNAGAESVLEVRKRLGVMSQCGKCSTLAREVIKEALETTGNTSSALFYEVA
ncbi:bacterioferritin-associated ferredoxin [Teredinibacter sp. KSP-S5-2]|uniref:bacterioferritin-associated ferredoxin n=1 Tax=Teredinibacter sp. KSP-S5-2 TaxID=3034506 RepID=UPI002934B6BA|nr:bacterioferritin-associated ferredoxin [Teredinibacter sp. KSP-S5-2]WNO10190.1 bacterioferritin-associated ferredoxin [Teredinibacter sp. KSP-S5-2]